MNDIGYVDLQYKTLSGTDSDIITIEGYANKAFNEIGELLPDRDEEVVSVLAYELDNFMLNPIVLFNHDRAVPVGTVTEVKLDDKGLFVKIEVHRTANEKVFNLVKSGIVKTFSIGFRGKAGKMVNDDIFMYTKVELYEVSIVTIPAAPQSVFSVVKDANGNSGFVKQKLLTKEANVTAEELKASEDSMKQLLDTLKSELVADIKSTLDDIVKGDVGAGEVHDVSLLDLIKEVELDADNIEDYITALNTLNTKINSKLTELIGE